MYKDTRKSLTIGALGGFGMALSTLLLAKLNSASDNSECLRLIINFLASVPVALFNMPRVLLNVLFFVYWILVGTVIGWLIGHKGKFARVAALMLVTALAIVHWIVKLRIEQDIDAAMRALGQWLTGGGIAQ